MFGNDAFNSNDGNQGAGDFSNFGSAFAAPVGENVFAAATNTATAASQFDLLDSAMPTIAPSNNGARMGDMGGVGGAFDKFGSASVAFNSSGNGMNGGGMSSPAPSANRMASNTSSMNAAHSASVNISVMGSPRMNNQMRGMSMQSMQNQQQQQQQDAFGGLGLPNYGQGLSQHQPMMGNQQQQSSMAGGNQMQFNDQQAQVMQQQQPMGLQNMMNNGMSNGMNSQAPAAPSPTVPQGTMFSGGTNSIGDGSGFTGLRPSRMMASGAYQSPVTSGMDVFDTNNLSASLGATLSSSGKAYTGNNAVDNRMPPKSGGSRDSFSFVGDMLK